MRTFNHRRTGSSSAVPLLIAIAIIVAVTFGCQAYSGSRERITSATVNSKERVCDSNGNGNGGQDCYYLVFTDKGTFKVTDSLFLGRFNSSDIYGQFRPDHVYNFDVIGWRVPFFSTYQNVASEPHEVKR
jgi:hypothetical protein